MSEKEKKTEQTLEKVDEHKKIKDSTQEGASMSEFEGSAHTQHEEPTTSSEKVEESTSTSTSEQIKYKGIARTKKRKPFKVPRSLPIPVSQPCHRRPNFVRKSLPGHEQFQKKYSEENMKLQKGTTSCTSERLGDNYFEWQQHQMKKETSCTYKSLTDILRERQQEQKNEETTPSTSEFEPSSEDD